MNAKTLGVLALIAAVAIGAAIYAKRSSGPNIAPAGDPAKLPLLPELKAALDRVAQVRIDDAEGSIDLRRDAQGVWRAQSLEGYPAKSEMIGSMLLTLANQESGEPKTDDPALYAEIGVEEPMAHPDAARVMLMDASGDRIAGLILGMRSERVIGDRFVRVVGEARAHRVHVPIAINTEVRTWVDQQILRLQRDRIAEVSVQQVDTPPVLIERTSPDVPQFHVAGLPESRTTSTTGALQQLFAAAAWLDFETVRPSTIDPTDASVVETTFRTVDGWSVIVRTWQDADGRWAQVQVIDAPEGAGDEITGAVDALRDRVSGWDYRLALPRYEALRPTLESLTTAAAPATPQEK